MDLDTGWGHGGSRCCLLVDLDPDFTHMWIWIRGRGLQTVGGSG